MAHSWKFDPDSEMVNKGKNHRKDRKKDNEWLDIFEEPGQNNLKKSGKGKSNKI